MAAFRKKPVVVQAEQYFPGKPMAGVYSGLVAELDYVRTAHNQLVYLEPGDWVIAEPDGRGHYPCKPDIFAATYEEA